MIASTTNSRPSCYRLAVTQAGDDRDAALAILQEMLGMNAIDARTRLGHVPSVWPEQFAEEPAREAVQRLQALGAAAAAVRATDVPDLRHGRTLHHIRCCDDGFVVLSISGEPDFTIPWGNIALLSVADVAGLRQESATSVPDGVFRHGLGITETHVEAHDLEMWLIKESPLVAYRIDVELMNYEYLQERRAPQAAVNFAELVADIRRYAPHVMLTPSAQAYVNESSEGAHPMHSPAAHRDAVAAFWAVEAHTRPQSQNRQGAAEPTTDSSKSPMSDDRLFETHRRLQEVIEALHNSCRDDLQEDPTVSSALLQQIAELSRTIDEHFRLEEEGGYMRSALEAAPRYSRLAASLQQQHEALRGRLRHLTEESGDLRAGIRRFITELEMHEHAENALVQSAFADDVAACD